MKKAWFCFVLAACLSLFFSCYPKNESANNAQFSAEDIQPHVDTIVTPEAIIDSSTASDSSYAIQHLTIDGIGIGNYVIVCGGSSNLTGAGIIQDEIFDAIGKQLTIKLATVANESEHSIVLCSSGFKNSSDYVAQDGYYGITSDGHDVYIYGSTRALEAYAAKRFVYDILGFNTKSNRAKNPVVDIAMISHYEPRGPIEFNKTEDYYTIATYVMDIDGLSSYNTYEGTATDGTYLYSIILDKGSTEGGCSIIKTNLETLEIVDSRANVQVGHGNDAVYVKKRNQIAVVDYTDRNKVHYLDPETLQIAETKTVGFSGGLYGISYNSTYDRYVYGIRGQMTFYIADEHEKVFSVGSMFTNATDQGLDCDDNYIYVAYSHENIIMIYDWNGKKITTIPVSDVSLEMEGLVHVGDVFYAAFYKSGGKGGVLYRIDFV
ncbi:MAG: hypothetical protein GXY60_04950 [Spirochaetales bacterium]|nr:hypothetical protein [Spirochaetales bacterium]